MAPPESDQQIREVNYMVGLVHQNTNESRAQLADYLTNPLNLQGNNMPAPLAANAPLASSNGPAAQPAAKPDVVDILNGIRAESPAYHASEKDEAHDDDDDEPAVVRDELAAWARMETRHSDECVKLADFFKEYIQKYEHTTNVRLDKLENMLKENNDRFGEFMTKWVQITNDTYNMRADSYEEKFRQMNTAVKALSKNMNQVKNLPVIQNQLSKTPGPPSNQSPVAGPQQAPMYPPTTSAPPGTSQANPPRTRTRNSVPQNHTATAGPSAKTSKRPVRKPTPTKPSIKPPPAVSTPQPPVMTKPDTAHDNANPTNAATAAADPFEFDPFDDDYSPTVMPAPVVPQQCLPPQSMDQLLPSVEPTITSGNPIC